MAQIIGHFDIEGAAKALAWNGYSFENAGDLISHLADEYRLSDREISEVDTEALLEAHKAEVLKVKS
jgi:hypothetical protein